MNEQDNVPESETWNSLGGNQNWESQTEAVMEKWTKQSKLAHTGDCPTILCFPFTVAFRHLGRWRKGAPVGLRSIRENTGALLLHCLWYFLGTIILSLRINVFFLPLNIYNIIWINLSQCGLIFKFFIAINELFVLALFSACYQVHDNTIDFWGCMLYPITPQNSFFYF